MYIYIMKKLIILLLIAGAATTALSGPALHRRAAVGFEHDVLGQEIDAILTENADRPIGELTVGELEELLNRISIAQQQAAYVQKSKAASFMLPGLGQFANDDPLAGTMFLAADLLATAGTLVGAYFLLPAELRFDQVDYFNQPFGTTEALWKSRSLADLLPSFGVAAAGGIVQGVLRMVAANHAAGLARSSIAEGKVAFEPHLALVPAGRGHMGFGISMRY